MTTEYVPGIPIMRPVINYDNEEYWGAMRRHKLVIQRCKGCGLRVHPPRPMCPRCLSTDREWVSSEGKGTIYSWVNFVYEKAGYPGIKTPYAVVVVELDDEGVRIVSNVVDMKPEEIYIGMPVEAVFDDVDYEMTLVKFRRREV